MEKKNNLYQSLSFLLAFAFVVACVVAYNYYDQLNEERERLSKCINSYHNLRETFIKDNKVSRDNMVDYYNFVAHHAHGMTIDEFVNQQGAIRKIIDAHDKLDKDLQNLLPY